jgi:hypothetical protein
LRQLPEKAGYALMQWFDAMPRTFRLQALPVQDDRDLAESKYPELWAKLTGTQRALLSSMLGRGRMTYSALYAVVRGTRRSGWEPRSNAMHCHIKNLRKALEGERLYIQTHREGYGMAGTYELLEGEVPSGRALPFVLRKKKDPLAPHKRYRCSLCGKEGHTRPTCRA